MKGSDLLIFLSNLTWNENLIFWVSTDEQYYAKKKDEKCLQLIKVFQMKFFFFYLHKTFVKCAKKLDLLPFYKILFGYKWYIFGFQHLNITHFDNSWRVIPLGAAETEMYHFFFIYLTLLSKNTVSYIFRAIKSDTSV